MGGGGVGTCFNINHSLLKVFILRHHFSLVIRKGSAGKKKHLFLPVHITCAAATRLNQPVLSETVSLNSNKLGMYRDSHISDKYMEPAFPLVLEFPLLTGLQQSVVQLTLVHLLKLFCSWSGLWWSFGFLLFSIPDCDKSPTSAVAPNTGANCQGSVEGVDSTMA